MKIAYIGNVCNYGYWFAKWMRGLDIEAELYIPENTIERDLPSWDDENFDKNNPPSWVKVLPNIPTRGFLIPKKFIISKLQDIYQKDIAHIFTASEAEIISISNFIKSLYHTTGGLDWVPYFFKNPYNVFFVRRFISSLLFRQMLKNVNRLIVSQPYELYYARKLITKKVINKDKIKILPMPYNCQLSKKLEENLKKRHFNKIRFFAPARHYWSMKGNDIIIKAYSKIVNLYKQKAPKMLMLRWGIDLEKSYKLIKSLNLEEFVEWKPVLRRDELLKEMSKDGTIIIDQFIRKYPDMTLGIGGISRDALLVETPLITHVNVKPELRITKTDPPILVVKSPTVGDLASVMEHALSLSCNKLQEIGKNGKEWLIREHDYRKVLPMYFNYYMKIVTGRN